MTTITLMMNEMKLSHELRISLAGILGGAELLSISEHLSYEEKEQLELIRDSGNRLLNIVNLILNNTKKKKISSESKKLATEFFNPHRLTI